MKRILITGRTGMIGSNIANYFQDKYDIWSCSRSFNNKLGKQHIEGCDLTILPNVQKLLDQVKPDIIFHFAANPIVKPNPNNPNELLLNNIIGTNNLLHCTDPKTLVIFSSSIVVYNALRKENTETSRTQANSLYSTSKIACEQLLHTYKEYKNLNHIILRLGATIGPNLTHGLIKDVIRKLQSDNPVLELFNVEPGPYKPYTYITDVLKGINLILSCNKRSFCPSTFNLCNNDPISVKEVAETIMKTLNIYKPIQWLNNSWPGDCNLQGDNSLMEFLDWNYMSSKEAIERCVNDIK